jgi:hypothetical protein
MKKDPPENDLLKRARLLQQISKEAEQDNKADSDSTLKRLKDSVKDSDVSQGLWSGIKNQASNLYDKSKIVRNVTDTGMYIAKSRAFAVLTLGASWVTRKYLQLSKKGFDRFAYDQDGEYNYKKGGTLIAAWLPATGFLAYKGVTSILPAFAIAIATTAYDATVVNSFAHWETHLYGKASVFSAEENVWTVSACDGYPCQGQVDTTAYRMRDGLYLDLREFWNHGQPHDPEELQAAFNSEQQACNVLEYGMRIKIPFAPASWGTFPHIIDAHCIPVDSDNWQEQLDYMRSIRPDVLALSQ